MNLSPYAQAHLRLNDIHRRFEAVMARYQRLEPKLWRDRMSWEARLARNAAQHQSRMFQHDIQAFDYYVHGKY